MSQLVQTEITIEGRNITNFSSLSLSQSIFEHHTFQLSCPAEAIDGTTGAILNTSRNLVGTAITIQISAIGSDASMQFKGLVTQVEAARYSGHAGDIIISGYSPTILMDNGPHCKSWENKTISDIAQDVIRHFPQNLLPSQVTPTHSEPLSYTVQYKETAWRFLSRLNSTYGEWFYYDGEKLVLGAPHGDEARLLYGSNLSQFNMMLQVRPVNFQVMAYDYIHHQVYNATPGDVSNRAGLSNLGQHALQKSEQFYNTNPRQWHNDSLTNQQQLDAFVNIRAAMQSSNMVRFTGNSGHPGVKIGGSIHVEGRNVFNQADETFGDYTILSTHHHCDVHGNYRNEFTAIPAGIRMPPFNIPTVPHCETQSALVTDNNDPEGLGRIRVRFHWMNNREKSPWIRVASPHAGSGKGMFFMPETDEEVIVGFEGDNPIRPYIIGSVYHGQAGCNFANSGNNIKAIQTRSGNKIIMNDGDGSVQISDSNGNNMIMDGNGNINVRSGESIVFTCENSKLEMKKDGTININGKVFTASIDDDINLNTKNIKLNGSQEIKIEGSSKGVSIKGMKVAVEGDTSMDLKGLNTKVEGNVQLDLKGGAMASLSAGIVKIN